jgi:hypothetical protein
MILSKTAIIISTLLAVSFICRAQQYADDYPEYQEYASEYGEQDTLYEGEHR